MGADKSSGSGFDHDFSHVLARSDFRRRILRRASRRLLGDEPHRRPADVQAGLSQRGYDARQSGRRCVLARPDRRRRLLGRAVHLRRGDWTALSAYGVALDQIGEHARARELYDEALALAPDAVSVLSNKALSYALSGDLSRAAQILRRATANRRGDARVRQNLALVLALKGELQEAERLARSDLPPQIADQNVGFYQALVAPSGYWGEFAAGGAETPDFDALPAAPSVLKQDAKQKDQRTDDGAPLALGAPTPATPASAETPPTE
jgi:tetratricopeptide (TPR) repeat protein